MRSMVTAWARPQGWRGLVLGGAALALLAGCNQASSDSIAEQAALESRVAALEAKVAELGMREGAAAPAAADMGTMGAVAASGAAVPASQGPGGTVTQGYEGVYVKIHVSGTEAKLAVNGRVVGTYSSSTNLYIDSMLTPGTLNTVGVSFSGAKEDNSAEIQVRSHADDNWNPVFNFMPQEGKLESSFEIPYLGKAE